MVFNKAVGGQLLAELVHDNHALEHSLLVLVLQPAFKIILRSVINKNIYLLLTHDGFVYHVTIM